MSVINQMLKDLDNRQQSATPQTDLATLAQPKSSKLVPFLLTAIVLLLLVIALFLWQLPATKSTTTKVVDASVTTESQLDKQQTTRDINKLADEKPNHQREADVHKPLSKVEKTPQPVAVSLVKESPIIKQNEQTNFKAEPEFEAKSAPVNSGPKSVSNKPLQQQNNTDLAVVTKEKPVNQKTQVQPSIQISTASISPDQLVQKKIAQAQQAIADNDLEKAEQLYEDALIIQPKNQFARENLAALWFGRGAYQAALNTLSQGIALQPYNPAFRLLKARIYLKQGLTEQAFTELTALSNVDNIEYLATQAGLAQQLGKWLQAEQSYLKLTQLQANQASWWLGYAIALDSQAKFENAAKSYQTALNIGGLAAEAKQFVQQRLMEIGE